MFNYHVGVIAYFIEKDEVIIGNGKGDGMSENLHEIRYFGENAEHKLLNCSNVSINTLSYKCITLCDNLDDSSLKIFFFVTGNKFPRECHTHQSLSRDL